MTTTINTRAVVRAALSAGVAIVAVTVATHTGQSAAHTTARPAVHLVADSATTSYPEVGVSVAPPALPLPPAAPQAASADAVMKSLRTSPTAEGARGLLGSAV